MLSPARRAAPLLAVGRAGHRRGASSKPWRKVVATDGMPRLVHAPPGQPPVTVAWDATGVYVGAERPVLLHPTALRDSCTCAACRDPASGNKRFRTTDMALDVGVRGVGASDAGLAVALAAPDASAAHETLVPWATVERAAGRARTADAGIPRWHAVRRRTGMRFWDARTLVAAARTFDFAAFAGGGPAFWDAVVDLCRLGIVFLRGVPRDEAAVAAVAARLGGVRETFYGRTFDVRAKPAAEADNVAYTAARLGLHQDLLYLEPPPMLQVLHCLDNSCAGGDSFFSDGDRVGVALGHLARHSRGLAPLTTQLVPYGYRARGRNYHAARPVIDQSGGGDGGDGSDGGDDSDGSDGSDGFSGVYWSPPFQAPPLCPTVDLRPWIEAARVFDDLLSADAAVYRRRLQPGECVIFHNLRVMHGRTAFDPAAGGHRWLRGAYVAAEDFVSTASAIPPGHAEAYRGPRPWANRMGRRDLIFSPWFRDDVMPRVRQLDPDVTWPGPRPAAAVDTGKS